jgi:hypothetical protein
VLYEAGTWGPGDDILNEDESWITKTWREWSNLNQKLRLNKH